MRPKLLVVIALAIVALVIMYVLKPKPSSESIPDQSPVGPNPTRPWPKARNSALAVSSRQSPADSGPFRIEVVFKAGVGEGTVDRSSLTNVGPVQVEQ
jgi:hypothetical protein